MFVIYKSRTYFRSFAEVLTVFLLQVRGWLLDGCRDHGASPPRPANGLPQVPAGAAARSVQLYAAAGKPRYTEIYFVVYLGFLLYELGNLISA